MRICRFESIEKKIPILVINNSASDQLIQCCEINLLDFDK